MTDKPRVLFVDDNVNLLKAIKRVLRKQAEFITAESGDEALKILAAEPEFAVLVSDQNMPNMKGDELLAEAAKRWPLTTRVMLTGNDDQMTAVAAVNTGKVFHFVRKPCEPDALVKVILTAAAHHNTLMAEKTLLEQTLAGSVKVLSDVLSALRPDLFQRTTKVRKGAKLVAKRLQLPNAWELDLAAMLFPLGLVSIPDAIAQKYAAGETLTPPEKQMIDQGSLLASNLISNIPRLENVAAGISMCRKGFDGSGFPAGGGRGNTIPLISRILRILIDLVDATAAGRMTLKDAGEYLEKQATFYDPELLGIVLEVIESSSTLEQPDTNAEICLKPAELLEGDIILKDILGIDGKLLLATGAELTAVTIQRLGNLAKSIELSEDIVVSRGTDQTQEVA